VAQERIATVCRPVEATAIAALMEQAKGLGEDEICVICEYGRTQMCLCV